MLGLTETLLFYLLVGVAVAVAVWLHDDDDGRAERAFRASTAIFFWPLYIPALLQGSQENATQQTASGPHPPRSQRPRDEMDSAIEQVESELDTALNSLGGWAENVLAREDARFSELRATWRTQAERIRELDRLLQQPEFLAAEMDVAAGSHHDQQARATEHRLRQTEESRRDNIVRLRAIRQQMYDDLMGTLAWVRELVTMIHLAKFTGAPATRAEELVAQIAAAVQGLSEVAEWQEDEELQTA